MNKIILPLVVIAASGTYAWSQQGRIAAENNINADAPSLDASAVPGPGSATPPPTARNGLVAPVAPAPAVAKTGPATVRETSDSIAADDSSEASEGVAETLPDAAQPAVAAPAVMPPPAPPAAETPLVQATDVPLPLPRPQHAPAPPQLTLVAATTPLGQFKDGKFRGPVADAYYGEVQVEADVQGGRLATVRILSYPNDRRTSRYINSQALPILKREAIQAQSGNVDFVSGATLTSRAYIQSLSSALDQASQ
jgi:uncharacterized protein with FMN-binding domain